MRFHWKMCSVYKTRPLVIIEVLLPATRRIDKTLKRLAYQLLETLQEYVLVEQDTAEVEVFSRQHGWRQIIITQTIPPLCSPLM